jgi:hypothetical protein
MLGRGIKSPDMADCMMMSEYALFMHRSMDINPHAMGML